MAASLLAALPFSNTCLATVRFQHLTMEDGLSNNEVLGAIQDKQGYIWLATGDGLDRYDGYEFKVFRHDPKDPASLAGSFVRTVYQDPEGRLWVGTFYNGLDLYDPVTGGFKHYRHIPGDSNSLISDNIWSLNTAPDGRLLIGTSDAGLDILDLKTGKFQHWPVGSGPDVSTSNRVQSIFIDSKDRIWLATSSGLDQFLPGDADPLRHIPMPEAKDSNSIVSIAEDAQHRLWLATLGGPYMYVPGQTAGTTLTDINDSISTISGVQLYSVYIDHDQDVWYGSPAAGLYLIRHGSGQILHYQHRLGDNESLSSDTIYEIFSDATGYIWVASQSGMSMLDPGTLDVYSLKPSDAGKNESDVSDSVEALHQYQGKLLIGAPGAVYQFRLDSQEDRLTGPDNIFATVDAKHFGGVSAITDIGAKGLLVGTLTGYLIHVSSTGHIQQAWLPGSDLGLRPRNIHRIVPLSDHEVLLGTFYDGLLDFNPETGKTAQIVGDSPNELARDDIVEDVLYISNTRLWVGTFRGLFMVNTLTHKSSIVQLTPGDTEPVIQGLYEDAKQYLWVATYGGLWRIKLDALGNPISHPETIPQLGKTQLLAIEPGPRGQLWLETENSLLRFDPSTGVSLRYARDQGSPITEYLSYGHTHTSNGWIWFAGGQGVVGFQPDSLQPNMKPPRVILNGVTSYRDGEPIYNNVPSAGPLNLSYQDAISIFDVSATSYDAPQANAYSYRLLGFQSAWTPPSTNHQVTFTNLSPGRYRLEVKASNNWGIWSTIPTTQDVVVLPPWWRTWWAYTLYLLIIIGSSIGYIYSLKRKIEREQEISTNLREANDIKSNFVEKLESQVRKATHELRETLQGVNLKNAELEIAQKRAAEAEQVKSQFLANMSHELRTPLTGVLGYTKLLGSTHLNSEQKDYVSTIKQSSETLLAIINDTLDLSRLEAGKLLIDQVDFDLLEVIESTLELLAPTAYQKRLELVRVVPADVPLYLRGDPLRLRQVLTNLLSNAIKFTEHGSVAIEVKALSQDEREAKLMFNISDTGIGIPSGELPKLFHAYARSRISTQHHVEGTGLGLAICKKLLDLMGGDIKVTSKVGTGTSFEFQLTFRVQKNAEPRSRLPRKIKVLLYDAHPLSNQAWRACLMRLGAEVETVPNLESVVSLKADAAIMALSEKELTQLGELKRTLTPVLPPMLILAPRIDRQALKDLSETLFHRVLSKTAREKTLYLELQSLLQTVVQDGDTTHHGGPSPVEPAADAPKILVADDNRINRRLLVTMLNHAGFRVSEAANGLELLDLAAKGPWDAALIDIHMPGMDGIEAANRLRASMGDKLPPVIAMSADVMPETRKQVLEGVMDDFMVKPFSEQELVDKLRWHLDRFIRRRKTDPQL